jgi:dTDP-4-amino-4,6-dideoxygalactose transaminase
MNIEAQVTPIPYPKPFADEREVAAVADVIRSGCWTNGPVVRRFESALRGVLGVEQVVCMANGTLALHALLRALLPTQGGAALYVTSSLNFVAGAAAAMQLGYDVALTDVDPATLNMCPTSLAATLARCARRYRKIVVNPVHFAGVLADTAGLADVARRYDAVLFEDACHALVGPTNGRPGACHPDSLAAVFSFHPTKNVAAGEGGAIASNDVGLMTRLAEFGNHNMSRKAFVNGRDAYDSEGALNPWYYEVREPGSNFRLSELHAALGMCQLERLPYSKERREVLARAYREAFDGLPGLQLFPRDASRASALHLFPVSFDLARLGCSKAQIFRFFAQRGIHPQVHYTPLHRQPAFSGLAIALGGTFEALEQLSPGLLSLPMYVGLTDSEQARVIAATRELCSGAR